MWKGLDKMSDYPKCPCCGSSNTDLSPKTHDKLGWANIGEFAIGFGAGLLGLGDVVQDVNLRKNIDAEFYCNNCGHVWIPGDIYGAVTEVWVNHNVENEGEMGLRIHAKFEINGMLNRRGTIQAFFYDLNGEPLKDSNDNFCTEDGSVTCGDQFQPSYENAIYNDFSLFIPYEELHLNKSCSLLCDVYISDGNNWVAKSSQIKINYEYYRPKPKIEAQIEKTWLDYDVQLENGEIGLLIHTTFVVNGLLDVTNQCNAYFYLENGEALKDFNDNYCTNGGSVCAGGEYTPNYENCRYNDFQLFIPYEELHVTGSGNLMYDVSVFNGDEVIACSERITFPFSYEEESTEDNNQECSSEKEQEYITELKECLSNGEISSGERRLLDKLRDKLGITPDRAKELEESLNAPKLTEDELEYLDEYQAVAVDGKITEKERRLLEKLRKMLKLTEERVKELGNCSFEVYDGNQNAPKEEPMAVPDSLSNANSELGELVFNVGDTSFKMKHVKGGTFTMGDTFTDESELLEDECDNIPHIVSLDDFFIEETLVTQGLWKSVMGYGKVEDENLPVNDITWNDCQKFIQKLNDILGFQLDDKKFSFPSEAEWEYAARGGQKSKGFEFSGSDDADEVAWYADNTNGSVQLVKQKKPNELGIYDMTGNVFEWCGDWYDDYYYQRSPHDNPLGPASGEKRVLRGGGYCQEESPYSVYCRYLFPQSESDSEIGFRLALKVISETKEVLLPNGDKYVGTLDSHGNITGNGTYYYSNGDRYEGEFKDGKRHGKGSVYYVDGQRYEGDFKNDEKDGNGRFFQTDGRTYCGDFKKGQLNGRGTIYNQNGNVIYEGEFKNGKMNGQGVLYFDNGNWYKGEFLNNQRSGRGIMYWANGEKYNGEWKEDKMDGLGKYYFADCSFKRCEYKKGVLQRWID